MAKHCYFQFTQVVLAKLTCKGWNHLKPSNFWNFLIFGILKDLLVFKIRLLDPLFCEAHPKEPKFSRWPTVTRLVKRIQRIPISFENVGVSLPLLSAVFMVADGKSIISHLGNWKVGVANAVLVDVVEKQLFGLELMKSGNLATNLREQDVAWRLSYIENLDCLVIKSIGEKTHQKFSNEFNVESRKLWRRFFAWGENSWDNEWPGCSNLIYIN